ncbi:hypothetical protein ACFFRR_002682 [Megaselia abdita]
MKIEIIFAVVLLNVIFVASEEYAIFYPNWKGAIEKLKANNTEDLLSLNASQVINKWIHELQEVRKKVSSNEITDYDIQYEKTDAVDVDVDAMRAIEEEITKIGEKIQKAIKAFEEGNNLFKRSKELVKTKVVDPVRDWFKKYL